MTQVQLKACPYCAEDIRAEAIKCKHCGSTLDGAENAHKHVKRAPGIKSQPKPTVAAPIEATRKVPGVLAWSAALGPLVMVIMNPVVVAAIQAMPFEVRADQLQFLILLVASIILCIADERAIKDAGYPIPVVKWESRIILFIFIVPFYLYKRAKLLKQAQWQFGAWIASFLIYLAS